MCDHCSHGLAEKVPVVTDEKCDISYLANESDKLGYVLGVDLLRNINPVIFHVLVVSRIINVFILLMFNESFNQVDNESVAQVIVKHLNSQDLQNVERLDEILSEKCIFPNDLA
jgi:hypothetical protein